MHTPPKPVIGWREWLALPALGIDSIKVKVDTGARTSSLHAFDIELFRKRGVRMVRFKVHPLQRNSKTTITGEEELVEQRLVRPSTGKQTLRPVIVTPVEMMGQRWDIELTLVNRDAMGFRMLLGRQGIHSRFVVHPSRSFFNTAHKARKTRKKRYNKE